MYILLLRLVDTMDGIIKQLSIFIDLIIDNLKNKKATSSNTDEHVLELKLQLENAIKLAKEQEEQAARLKLELETAINPGNDKDEYVKQLESRHKDALELIDILDDKISTLKLELETTSKVAKLWENQAEECARKAIEHVTRINTLEKDVLYFSEKIADYVDTIDKLERKIEHCDTLQHALQRLRINGEDKLEEVAQFLDEHFYDDPYDEEEEEEEEEEVHTYNETNDIQEDEYEEEEEEEVEEDTPDRITGRDYINYKNEVEVQSFTSDETIE
jgi:chromosome segregation ATPase